MDHCHSYNGPGGRHCEIWIPSPKSTSSRNMVPRLSSQLHCRTLKRVLPILQQTTSSPEPRQEKIENDRSFPLLERRKNCPDSPTAFLNYYGEISTRSSWSDVNEQRRLSLSVSLAWTPGNNTPHCASDDNDNNNACQTEA